MPFSPSKSASFFYWIFDMTNYIELPDIDYLNECFYYDESSGLLTWKIRPLSHFFSSREMKIINKRNGGTIAGSLGSHGGYMHTRIEGKLYACHRIIWKLKTSRDPIDQIDHIDMNRANNVFSNLREANNKENKFNSKKHIDNKSGFKGVSFFKRYGNYKAQISINGKNTHIGYFTTPELAYEAYKKKAIELHGAFVRL